MPSLCGLSQLPAWPVPFGPAHRGWSSWTPKPRSLPALTLSPRQMAPLALLTLGCHTRVMKRILGGANGYCASSWMSTLNTPPS